MYKDGVRIDRVVHGRNPFSFEISGFSTITFDFWFDIGSFQNSGYEWSAAKGYGDLKEAWDACDAMSTIGGFKPGKKWELPASEALVAVCNSDTVWNRWIINNDLYEYKNSYWVNSDPDATLPTPIANMIVPNINGLNPTIKISFRCIR